MYTYVLGDLYVLNCMSTQDTEEYYGTSRSFFFVYVTVGICAAIRNLAWVSRACVVRRWTSVYIISLRRFMNSFIDIVGEIYTVPITPRYQQI